MSAREAPRRPIAVTMGEPAGIGGELIIKAWLGRKALDLPPFFVIDDRERLQSIADDLGFGVNVGAIAAPEDLERKGAEERLSVLPLSGKVNAVPGAPSVATAPAVIESIRTAVELTRSGRASALVTNPVHKRTLYDSGFDFPGHTEYLGALAGVEAPVMLLTSPVLRVVPVTVHMALAQAVASLTTAMIVRAARVAIASLRRDFGIARPRIAVSGLNPHAGEGGALGHEEERIIQPAIEQLADDDVELLGPVPADTLFHEKAREGYDLALCMYHDQALIPLKTLSFDEGVNVTLGLPFVRTSPDHGTALALAGTGRARESSLAAALRTAASMALNRNRHG